MRSRIKVKKPFAKKHARAVARLKSRQARRRKRR